MAGSFIQIDIDDRQVTSVLDALIARGQDLEPVFAEIGEYLDRSHRDRWDSQRAPDGSPWAPLSETTQKLKPKNKDKILVLEGYMRDLLRYQATPDSLVFGTDRPQAALMHFGGVTSPNSMIPGKTIPARPFLGLSDDDRREVLEILTGYLEGAAG